MTLVHARSAAPSKLDSKAPSTSEPTRPPAVRRAVRASPRDDFEVAAPRPRGVLTEALRDQLKRVVMTRELPDLTGALAQLFPQGPVRSRAATALDVAFSHHPSREGLVGAMLTARTGEGVTATRTRFAAFSHDPTGARLRSLRLNWIEDADVRADSVRVLLERDAEGQALDGATRYQELLLHLDPAGRVSALTIRNGNHRALKSVWPSHRVELD